MQGLLPTCSLLLAAAVVPRPAGADRLLVYGPPGSGTERRALAVVERDDGTCAPWASVAVVGEEPGVEVTLEPADGDACARWLNVASSPARSSVTLVVRGRSSAETRAAIAMGEERRLSVRATRAGGNVRVRVTGAPVSDTVVTALWADGQSSLRASGGSDFTGEAPPDRLLAIVARSGDLVGADALPVAVGPGGSQTLVLPSALAVPAGAAVRTAAFVIVTDQRGRLSRDVPLHVVSERGRLRSMVWIAPGVAAVALTTDAGVSSVDLSAWTTAESDARSIEIPVQSDWPLRATLTAPAQIERGHDLVVSASAMLVGGAEATDAVHLAVRCGEVAATRDADGRFRCTLGAGPTATVVATAVVDGRALPLAQRLVQIREPRPPAPVADVARPLPQPRARRVDRGGPEVAPAVSLAAGLNTAGGASWGAGLGALWSAAPRLLVTAIARYEGSWVDVPGVDEVRESLVGMRHGAELLLGGAARLLEGRTSLVAGAAAGPSWVWSDLRVGNAGADSSALRLVARVSAGPRTRFAGLEIGLDLGLRLVPISSETTWHEPLATGFVEINGALGRR